MKSACESKPKHSDSNSSQSQHQENVHRESRGISSPFSHPRILGTTISSNCAQRILAPLHNSVHVGDPVGGRLLHEVAFATTSRLRMNVRIRLKRLPAITAVLSRASRGVHLENGWSIGRCPTRSNPPAMRCNRPLTWWRSRPARRGGFWRGRRRSCSTLPVHTGHCRTR